MALFSTATNTRKSAKRILIILVIAIVIIATAMGVRYYYFVPHHTTQPPVVQSVPKGDDLSVIIQKEQDFKANNQTDQGLAYYDTQIKLHAGQDDQSDIMLAKAKLALNVHKLDVALVAAKEANQTKKSYRTLQLIGDVTQAKGDTMAALDYYKQALTAVPSNMPMIGPNNVKAQLNAMIKELSA